MSLNSAQHSRSIQRRRFWSLIRPPHCVTPSSLLALSATTTTVGCMSSNSAPNPQTGFTYFKPSRIGLIVQNWGVDSCASPSCALTSTRNYAACGQRHESSGHVVVGSPPSQLFTSLAESQFPQI